MKQQHPAVKVKYLAAYCFSGTYIITLLTDGYNFSSESYSSIKFIKKVGGGGSRPRRWASTRLCCVRDCPSPPSPQNTRVPHTST